MGPLDLGALGFWLFFAAIFVVSAWAKSRREAEKHETLRRIVEKTGAIDEARLKELFIEPPPDESKPGYGYRVAARKWHDRPVRCCRIGDVLPDCRGLGKVFGATDCSTTSGGRPRGYFGRHRDGRPGILLLLSLRRTASPRTAGARWRAVSRSPTCKRRPTLW